MPRFTRSSLFALAVLAVAAITLQPGDRASAQTVPDPVPLGVNLALFKDWGSEIPLVDVFASSREWISSAVDSSEWDSGV
jgi:hypothetical protein